MPTPAISTIVLVCTLTVLSSGCATSVPIASDELSNRLARVNLVLVPEGEGPFPTVLLLHTCFGNLGHVNKWARQLRTRGYAAVVVNSMMARELGGHFDRMAVCGGRAMRASDRSRDIGISIDNLKRLPNIDVERIGIVGFSHGGWTALRFLGERDQGSGITSHQGVKSVVVVYPYCGAKAFDVLTAWPREVRMLMLLAGNDTTVGTGICRDLAREQRQRGYAVDTHVYPRAEHGYDIHPDLIYGYDRRYDESAARDTRKRIIAFLDETLMTRGTKAMLLTLTRSRVTP